MGQRILFIDRPSLSSRSLEEALGQAGFELLYRESVEAAFEEEDPDLILASVSSGGERLLAKAEVPVLLLVDFATESEVQGLLKQGATNVLVRPIDEASVLAAVRHALEHHSLQAENDRLRAALQDRFRLGSLVSRDPRMRRIFQTVEAVADSRASMLIVGESGTGKTVLARAAHERSDRADKPFVVVNCGALPTSLLESELFGHAKGAFTGADRDRPGKFESADSGTLFLDEIGTAPLELQVKLLRVIEDGLFERVGETRTRRADVRVIAATNVDLEAEIAAGRFRSDLYYRIHVVGIEIPPLRERPLDVPILAERFLQRFAEEHRREVREFDENAMAALCVHEWPGNIRELENTVERAVLLARSERLTIDDLWPDRSDRLEHPVEPSAPWGEIPLGPLKEALAIPERWILLRALRHHGGNRQKTAGTLGINRTTLFNKMRKHGLSSFPTKAPGADDDPEVRRAG